MKRYVLKLYPHIRKKFKKSSRQAAKSRRTPSTDLKKPRTIPEFPGKTAFGIQNQGNGPRIGADTRGFLTRSPLLSVKIRANQRALMSYGNNQHKGKYKIPGKLPGPAHYRLKISPEDFTQSREGRRVLVWKVPYYCNSSVPKRQNYRGVI